VHSCPVPDELCGADIGEKLPGLEMKTANKFIIVNFGIATGLALELFEGASPRVVGSAGVLLLMFANLVLYFSLRRRRPGR